LGIWDFLIVQPIAFLLRSLYGATGSFGVSIILFGVVAKIVLLWFQFKGKRGMLQQQRVQPKLQELQKKYGKDRQKMQQEQAKLYQDEGISMFGGCLWMLIPFPIIIALYGAVRRPLEYILRWTREDVAAKANSLWQPEELFTTAGQSYNKINQLELADQIGEINFSFLGINLSDIPSFGWHLIVLVPLVSALSSFVSVYLTQKFSGRPPAAGNSQMMIFLLGPGVSLWLGFILPAALGVYWISQNLLGIPQEYLLTKYWTRKLDEEDAAKVRKEERRKAAEAVQKEEDRQRRAERIAAQNKKHKPKRYKLQNKPVADDEKPAPNEGLEDEE
jgi:YidC/Oxa1 family membrane protein insertase